MARLGEKIRSIRIKRKLTTIELAQRARLSQSTISEIENDRRSPTVDTLFSICQALKVSILDVLPPDFYIVDKSLEIVEIANEMERLNDEQRKALLNFIRTISKN